MDNLHIAITGANGFIGDHLVKKLSPDYPVTAMVHHMPEHKHPSASYLPYELTQKSGIEELQGVSHLIHCAYIPHGNHRDAYKGNLEGTMRLREMCREAGVKKFIFLSSMSAHKHTKSSYGKYKYAAERLLNQSSDLVLKPGLVMGEGGLADSIATIIKRNHFIPMTAGGAQPIQTIHIDDLMTIIMQAIHKNISGSYIVAEKEAITLRTLYSMLSTATNTKNIFINMPAPFIGAALKIIESLPIETSISYENFLGMKSLVAMAPCDSTKIFNVTIRNVRESIANLTPYLQRI